MFDRAQKILFTFVVEFAESLSNQNVSCQTCARENDWTMASGVKYSPIFKFAFSVDLQGLFYNIKYRIFNTTMCALTSITAFWTFKFVFSTFKIPFPTNAPKISSQCIDATIFSRACIYFVYIGGKSLRYLYLACRRYDFFVARKIISSA